MLRNARYFLFARTHDVSTSDVSSLPVTRFYKIYDSLSTLRTRRPKPRSNFTVIARSSFLAATSYGNCSALACCSHPLTSLHDRQCTYEVVEKIHEGQILLQTYF